MWTDLRDVPTTVDDLTVSEVGDCLRLLKLDRSVIDEFTRHDIDGAFLVTMDEQLMQRSFQMTPLEARKLCQFARNGWRPRLH